MFKENCRITTLKLVRHLRAGVSDFIPSNQENTQQNGVMKAVHVFTFAPFLMDNKFNEHINSINNLTHMRSTVYYGTPYTFIFKIFVNITIKETLQRVHMIALCALGGKLHGNITIKGTPQRVHMIALCAALGGKLHKILTSGCPLNHTYCTTILNIIFFC
jgi:hypothetical protein